MKPYEWLELVPAQYTGKEVEVEASVELKDDAEAKLFYRKVQNRLLDVNNWHQVAGTISARFQLADANGKEVERGAQKNDHLRIDIPGPGSTEGDGYDWVLVEALKEISEADREIIGFRVRPCENPLGKKNETAHFYAADATSNFIVSRNGTRITAFVIDRNLQPNEDPESLMDKVRDSAVGMMAIGMFSKIQWQNLVNGLVADELT